MTFELHQEICYVIFCVILRWSSFICRHTKDNIFFSSGNPVYVTSKSAEYSGQYLGLIKSCTKYVFSSTLWCILFILQTMDDADSHSMNLYFIVVHAFQTVLLNNFINIINLIKKLQINSIFINIKFTFNFYGNFCRFWFNFQLLKYGLALYIILNMIHSLKSM